MEKIDKKDILEDRQPGSKKANPWQEKKRNSQVLSSSFKRLGKLKKAARLKGCGNYVQFKEYIETGIKKLDIANFCKIRMCPMCGWRRSKKVFAQISQIMDAVQLQGNYRFLFLTLTQANIPGDELPAELDKMFTAWKRFQQNTKFKTASVGWFRALEVTHDSDQYITTERYSRAISYYQKKGLSPGDPNPNYNMYHPHFHVIICVKRSYFKTHYIKGSDFSNMWARAMKLPYLPNTDITRFEDQTPDQIKASISEAAKYTVKDSDWLKIDKNGIQNEQLIDEIVSNLDEAIKKRRLIAFGGLFKQIRKELQLDDPLDGDLVHTGEEELHPELDYVLKLYIWNVGFSNYFYHHDKKIAPERDKNGNIILLTK